MGVQAFKRGGQGIMKKKAAFIIIEFLLLIFFILSNSLWIRISVFTIECLIIYLILSYRQYNNYCKEKFPGTVTLQGGIMISLMWEIYGLMQMKKIFLDITGVRRNLYTDILIIERYYSFLKPYGTVVVCINFKDKYYLTSRKVSVFDITALHEVTLWEHGIDARGRDYKLHKLVGGALFLVAKYLRFTFASVGKDSIPLKEMQQLKGFCKLRGISIKYCCYNISESQQNVLKHSNLEDCCTFM